MLQQQWWGESWCIRNDMQHAVVEPGTRQITPACKSSGEKMIQPEQKGAPPHLQAAHFSEQWGGRQMKISRTNSLTAALSYGSASAAKSSSTYSNISGHKFNELLFLPLGGPPANIKFPPVFAHPHV